MNTSRNERFSASALRDALPKILLVAVILLFFIYFGLYATQRHLAFETGAFDTGVYAQPLWNFINGRGFAVTTIEDNGPLRWATHVEPILFLVAPLYALWPDPRTLFWLQVAAISLIAIPAFALATRRVQNQWAALAIVLAFFLMPATQAVTLFDFHAVTMAPLFLLCAIYFLDRALAAQGKSFWLWPETSPTTQPAIRNSQFATRYYVLSGLFFLLALSTKEDISLHVFMIGLYLLILRKRWWEGSLLVLVGLAWFYVTFQMIIPAYRTAGGQSIYAAWFETLGDTPLEIALSPITAPGKVLAFLFQPDRIPALAMITVPMALLPWVGLPLFILAAPSLAFSLLSQNPTLRQLETWHYAAPMLAFVLLGTIDGMARAKHYAPRLTRAKVSSHTALIWLTIILLTTAVVYQYLRGYTHLSRLPEWPTVTAHHTLGRDIAATIPTEASVLAQAQLVPYVAHREELGIWSGPLDPNYDYIWLDLSHPKFPNRFDSHGDLLIGMIYEHAFGTIINQDGYLLLQKGADRTPISDELFTFTQFDQPPATAQLFNATFGNKIKLLAAESDVRRLATSETEPQIVLYFETIDQPVEDYHLFVYLLDENGTIVGATDYPQPSIFWWATSRWQIGNKQQVRVNTIPWWTGDQTSFSYAIGFSHTNDPWDVSARLPVDSPTAIDNSTLLPIATFYRFAGIPYPATIEGEGE